jgi:HK97 family phage portal protein
MFDAFSASPTLSGERVSVESSLAMADVFAAVNLICEEVSKLPLKVYRDLSLSPDNPQTGIEEQNQHRAWRMLHDLPNPYTPSHRFWSTLASHLLLWGNGFIEKLRDMDGLVVELRLVHPSRVDVLFNEEAGLKAYRVTRMSGTQEPLMGDDRILHVFGVSCDGIFGLSPIQQSREALGIVKARERFEGEMYSGHPYASGVIQHPNKLGTDAPKRIRENWRVIYGRGSRDRGGVAVLEEGATYKSISAPLADMQYVENSQLSKTQIANIFKLPPTYIGGSLGDSMTYQTVEANRIWLASQTIAPLVNNIAQYVSHDSSIFPFPSWYCAFDLSESTQGDSKTRAEVWQLYKDMGVVDATLIAEREGLPPPPKPKPKPVPPALLAAAQPPSAGNGTIPSVVPGA